MENDRNLFPQSNFSFTTDYDYVFIHRRKAKAAAKFFRSLATCKPSDFAVNFCVECYNYEMWYNQSRNFFSNKDAACNRQTLLLCPTAHEMKTKYRVCVYG